MNILKTHCYALLQNLYLGFFFLLLLILTTCNQKVSVRLKTLLERKTCSSEPGDLFILFLQLFKVAGVPEMWLLR